MVFLMWVAFSLQFYLNYDLGFLGIYPLKATGFIGIVTAPLIHGNLSHIISNTFPLLFLGTTLYVFYPKIASWVFASCYLLTGLLVWIFGRDFYHIGASGLIYGVAFFLIFLGLFRKDMKSLIISIFVVAIYGGMVYGLWSDDEGVSWESHSFGAAVGVALSFVYRKQRE